MRRQSSQKRPKIIYVMGCGRSGSTILGFLLGNGEKACDLGEVIDFLKRDGNPNSFGPDTENGKFWFNVKQLMIRDIDNIFSDETKLKLLGFEHHKMFLPIYLGLTGSKTKKSFQNYINHLYMHIADELFESDIFIDTSKYPSRALLLESLLDNFDIGIVHLIRHPIKVVESFGDKATKQGYKGLVRANIYYFFINLFCLLVKLKVGNNKYLKIKFEDILNDPEKSIDQISKKFTLDLDNVKKIIRENKPLKRGYLFNGNRMRMKEEVVLKKTRFFYQKNIKNFLTMSINAIWY